jgi:hypothetical protein
MKYGRFYSPKKPGILPNRKLIALHYEAQLISAVSGNNHGSLRKSYEQAVQVCMGVGVMLHGFCNSALGEIRFMFQVVYR